MKKILTFSAMALAAALTLTACGDGETQTTESGLPSQMVWSTYGTGTSTYADTAAVAEALTSAEGANIRIVPSDTAIGQLTPLREGQAGYTRTGDAYIYAFEADYDFAVPDWGPQDVQVTWAPTAPHGLMVRADSGIESVEDLKGKKVARATANPSVQNKTEAILAYGGLTWDDVEPVNISYGDQAQGLQNGQIDALYQQVYGSSLFELESAVDVRWLELSEPEGEAADRVEEIAPSTYIDTFSNGPGQEEGEETYGLYYAVPMITMADTPEEEVHALATALHENFDGYKDVTQTTPGWGLDKAQVEPTEVPFHPGLVRFLDEQGKWSEEAEAKNTELIERGQALREEWPKYVEQAGDNINAEDWTAWKDENIPE
ncbi:TAXI family TRAP transporter solute-binding subunit [Brevibacterium daeguense]|uniref:TAXI family TRAP transporter solute-binding subunit n=1 Tax=Brevibacterium daeguense TaxID=909936 RepID=A0ABP8EHE3_9MICO|nr:TAXI family TRAP transporter solute-binding subunit [Brevibacterium daeguense]